MRWFAAIAVTAATVYVLILLGLALKRRLFPPRCPRCGEPGLQQVLAIPTPGGGGRCDWSYHRCPACGAKLKLYYGTWSDPPEDEWVRMNPPSR